CPRGTSVPALMGDGDRRLSLFRRRCHDPPAAPPAAAADIDRNIVLIILKKVLRSNTRSIILEVTTRFDSGRAAWRVRRQLQQARVCTLTRRLSSTTSCIGSTGSPKPHGTSIRRRLRISCSLL